MLHTSPNRGRILSIVFASIFLLVLTFVNCGRSDRNPNDKLRDVKAGITTSYLGEAATFVAKEKGFFEDHGLNVTLKHNPSGSVSIKDLFNGKVEIAHVAETPIVYSLLDSSYYDKTTVPSFQIFSDMIYSHKIQKIIARRDHGIASPKDIAGKKVAIFKGTQLDYYFDSFLLEHQIPSEEVTFVNMKPIEEVESIKNGEVDVAVNWEPYVSYIQNLLGDKALTLQTDLTYSTLWMTTTLDSYAEANPDILVAYLRSLADAQNYIRDNPEETQRLLARHTDISIKIIRSLWNEIDYELSLSERMLTLLEDQARWMIRKGIADTSGYNMEHLVNYNPMQKVHPLGITVLK